MSTTASPPIIEYYRPAILDEILDGGHKVIDASAGTGKTFTIEHIVVDLLRTGAALLDQILVVDVYRKSDGRTALANPRDDRGRFVRP